MPREYITTFCFSVSHLAGEIYEFIFTNYNSHRRNNFPTGKIENPTGFSKNPSGIIYPIGGKIFTTGNSFRQVVFQ